MSNPIICFNDSMTEESVGDLLEKIAALSGLRKVHITSPGGNFMFFSTLAPQFSSLGYTAIGDEVHSAAIILLLLGRRRLLLPHATLFFHEIRAMIDPIRREMNICELEEYEALMEEYREQAKIQGGQSLEWWLQDLRNAQNWFLSFIRDQTGIPAGRIVQLMRDEVTLSAREAVQYGFAERVASADEIVSLY